MNTNSSACDDASSDSTELDQRETVERIGKLQLERQRIRKDLSPAAERRDNLRAVAGLGGVLAAFVALATFAVSFIQWKEGARASIEVRIEERLDFALRQLGSDSAQQRLGGVVSLQSFLGYQDDARQTRVLSFLTHTLAIERDPIVRGAVIQTFRNIDVDLVSLDSVDAALKSLVALSRVVVRKASLNRERNPGHILPEPTSDEAVADAIAAAIVSLVRIGGRFRDFSGIYCVRCNFSGLSLDDACFDDAILSHAEFVGTSLRRASFDRADLEEVYFIRANLRDAAITMSEPARAGSFSTFYYWDRLENGLRHVSGPDFSCADLRGVDFAGRVLFGFSILPGFLPGNLQPPTFAGALLDNADFREIDIFLVFSGEATPPFPTLGGGGGIGERYSVHDFDVDPSRPLLDNAGEFCDNLNDIRVAFRGSNWKEAMLPVALREVFAKNPPPPEVWERDCDP